MYRIEERLKTFVDWPVPFLSPEILAANGFYYLGRGDEVRCAFCKVEIMGWVEGDDPVKDHHKWAPKCPFLAGAGADECGTVALLQPKPKHPQYVTEHSRLASYSDWPPSMAQTPQQMAEAGFYYTGKGDKTVCFYCDLHLKDWEAKDNPWEEHARWFDSCAYVSLVKGPDYAQKVITEAHLVGESSPAMDTSVVAETTAATDCIICCSNERRVCFVPCGHVVACTKCALTCDVCPMCRQNYTSVIRVYFS